MLGLAIGLTLGAKHSALPGLSGITIVGLEAAVWSSGRDRWVRLGKLAAAGMIGWALLWTLFAGHFHAARDGSDPFNRPLAKKIGDLHCLPRTAIALVDQWRIFPRACLWGLADTVRTGVEGRELRTLFFGRWFTGRASFYFLARAAFAREARASVLHERVCGSASARTHFFSGDLGRNSSRAPHRWVALHFGWSRGLPRHAITQSRAWHRLRGLPRARDHDSRAAPLGIQQRSRWRKRRRLPEFPE
ncbi:MAG: hypothetical protein ABIU29_11705 [Chthoniobacterales bacterium]